MKKTIFSVVLLSLVIFCAKAQDYENFYSIKEKMEAHFDSLIEINGIENMQGTGYNPFKRWVDYWEPLSQRSLLTTLRGAKIFRF